MIDNKYTDEVKANMIWFNEMAEEFMKIHQFHTQTLSEKRKRFSALQLSKKITPGCQLIRIQNPELL